LSQALLIRPRFDEATSYSWAWAGELAEEIKGRFNLTDLSDGVSRKQVEEAIKSKDPYLIVFYDHGIEGAWIGNAEGEHIIDLTNVQLLTNRIAYSMACIPEGYHIYTNDGIKDISEVKEGDYVLSHNGTFDKVIKTFKRQHNGEIIVITPKVIKFPIKLTPEHPVLACRFKMKGKKPHYQRVKSENWQLEWIEAKNLKKGDYVVFPLPNFEDDKFAKSFLEAFTEPDKIFEFMELAGFYVAEGDSIGKEGIRFSFGSHEVGRIKRVKELIRVLFNKEPSVVNQGSSITVRLGDYVLSRLFRTWFGCKAKLKKMPMWIITMPKIYLIPFLKGLFAGDGSIYVHHFQSKSYHVITYATSSEVLAHQLLFLFSRFGIVPTVNIEKQRKWGNRSKYTFAFRGSNMIKLAKLLEVKISEPKELHNKAFIFNNFIWMEIGDIKTEQFNGFVYNIEVEGSNSYVCEGITVHNCLSAKGLGVEAYRKGCKVFVGYADNFTFNVQDEKMFGDCANYGLRLWLKGESDWAKIKQSWIEFWNKMIDSASDPWTKMFLRSDRDALRVITKGVDEPTETKCFFRSLALKLFGTSLGWKITRKAGLSTILLILGLASVLTLPYIGIPLILISYLLITYEYLNQLK